VKNTSLDNLTTDFALFEEYFGGKIFISISLGNGSFYLFRQLKRSSQLHKEVYFFEDLT